VDAVTEASQWHPGNAAVAGSPEGRGASLGRYAAGPPLGDQHTEKCRRPDPLTGGAGLIATFPGGVEVEADASGARAGGGDAERQAYPPGEEPAEVGDRRQPRRPAPAQPAVVQAEEQ
jgi:hypothetical protein